MTLQLVSDNETILSKGKTYSRRKKRCFICGSRDDISLYDTEINGKLRKNYLCKKCKPA